MTSTPQPSPAPPFQFSQEEEDAIIHTRIYNDDRPLRRVVKKFHTYVSSTQTPDNTSALNDARESFLVELESFRLALSKSAMICEAETRQVEEYQKERQRIDDEHSRLIGQIEQLKGSLEHAQMDRRRKMEYDLVAEKINTLPSRFELEKIIHSLENDIVAVRTEHETLNRSIHMQKVSFDSIVGSLGALRLSGKDTVDSTPRLTPAPETLLLEAEPEPEPEPEPEHDIEMGEVEEDPKSKKKAREEMEEGEATDASSELSEVPDDE